MPLSSFHPVVSRWFTDTLGTPTAAQARGWAAIREGRHTLIAAPTGSGKTLAAFLTALDQLFQEAQRGPLPDEVRVVYVSPLKALSADIHKNLAEPRRGIRALADQLGLEAPRITAAVRTGDTTSSERAAMLRTPPHILVTTPESLYLLLTADRSRAMLKTARTVIVDEIHAVIGTRRGAHLALTIERLQQAAGAPLQRLGLSATQKPIEEVARYLVGCRVGPASPPAEPSLLHGCAIIDEGHRRVMDLALELPSSALEAVMSHEVWQEIYARLTALIEAHKTTLVFVNTRRMAERLARHLSERLGEDAVTAHHGSLSKEKRLDAETRLKTGRLRALVATASLELGIDIGHVDLVCQIGSPHRIATLLQRVGRSGHTVSGTPKGRLFPVSRDDLIESAALLRAVRQGDLDRIVQHDAPLEPSSTGTSTQSSRGSGWSSDRSGPSGGVGPLDVLAQQVVAESSCGDYSEDDLFALVRRAWPYRALPRASFDGVVRMVAEGFATRRGRRGALVHRDEVNARLRGRRGARMLAITSGGAIPEIADYRVVLEPGDTFIGTLNEDFAIESSAGDVFQLGNASWRVLQVAAGTVRVADAKGAPPTIPFWLGEAPARSDELSRAVSDLRAAADRLLDGLPEDFRNGGAIGPPLDLRNGGPYLQDWLIAECGLSPDAAEQAAAYLADARQALGVLPTQDTLVLERFFDESGGMQLVLHAPFGSRVNKAWGLALRKRFCRQFNFELQAAATEDGLLLSLGPQHSFPLSDVFRYLHPASVRDILVQAFLDAPVFQTRWRWNTTISLAVPRNRSGRKVPPQLQRMIADDLMAAVFPDAAACLENIPGDREIPDHPLVSQTIRDCLQEAMDLDGLVSILDRIHRGDLRCVSRDTVEPSPLTHEILNARPYAFLDDAPLEERRAHAVYTRRASQPAGAEDIGRLDAAAIERVRDEVRPDPRDADELHDALLTAGFLFEHDASPAAFFAHLAADRRATRLSLPDAVTPASLPVAADSVAPASPPAVRSDAASPAVAAGSVAPASLPAARSPIWIAAERLPELLAVHPDARFDPAIVPPASRAAKAWTREEALVEIVRGRLTMLGPTHAPAIAESLAVDEAAIEAALLALESEGVVLRGRFTHPASGSAGAEGVIEWCDRRLLARIHRYTLNRLRAEIEAVSVADYSRFLFAWQHASHASRLTGIDGVRAIVGVLDGFELAAGAWERAVLPARLDRYDPGLLDMLCLTGEVGWARLSAPAQTDGGGAARMIASTPIALFLREHGDAWLTLREGSETADSHAGAARSGVESGFSRTPGVGSGFSRTDGAALSDTAQRVLDVLCSRGASFVHEFTAATALPAPDLRRSLGELVTAGLVASDAFAGLREIIATASPSPAPSAHQARGAGRWWVLQADPSLAAGEAAVEACAWALLRRYGVVFRRLLAREPNAPAWRALTRVYRRLEARGEIRGGRFVTGMSGEQFALPDAVDRLREIRRTAPDGRLVVLSAADPLNLTGILTAGERVRTIATNRLVYRDGVAIAAMEGDYIRQLSEIEDALAGDVASLLAGRRVPPVLSGYVGRTG